MGAPCIAGLLLAAGAGRRYGKPKALVEFGSHLLVEHGLATLQTGGCDPVVVVIGAAAAQVVDRADLSGAQLVINGAWPEGMGSSLRAGLAALGDTRAAAAVILLVDMPGITPAAVARVAVNADPAALSAATYAGRRGHPVLLGREHWAGVALLAEGDMGARAYLDRHAGQLRMVPCDEVATPVDLDFPTVQ